MLSYFVNDDEEDIPPPSFFNVEERLLSSTFKGEKEDEEYLLLCRAEEGTAPQDAGHRMMIPWQTMVSSPIYLFAARTISTAATLNSF